MIRRLAPIALAFAGACDNAAATAPQSHFRRAAELPACDSCVTIDRPDTPPLDGPERIAPAPEQPVSVPPPTPVAPRDEVLTRFSHTPLGAPDLHRITLAADDGIAYGVGAALLDIDGDLLPDLFVATGGDLSSDACVYHNRSSPSEIAFERVDAWCFDAGLGYRFGFGVDVENDGVDELLAGRRDRLMLHDFDDATSIDLSPLFDQPCLVTSVAHTDLDYDGDADLLVACAIELVGERLAPPQPLVGLRRTPVGFERMPPAEVPWGDDPVNVLALATFDAEYDGDLDIAVLADTFSRPGSSNLRLDPGGLARRCSALEPCAFEQQPFFAGPAAWGSFMGASPFRLGSRRLVYLTDWGVNRAIDVASLPAALNEAPLHRLQPPPPPARDLFSWSALVEDFDLDGDDDLLVTGGEASISFDRSGWRFNYDALMTQGTAGVFVAASEAVGLLAHAFADDSGDAPHYSSRGAARADLDLDGRLDVIVLPFIGDLRAYTVDSDPVGARCTIHVMPSIVEGRHGYAVLDPDGQAIDRLAEGHMRFGTPRSFTTTLRHGEVRFPSGARVAFTCDESNEAIVREPEWISLAVDGCLRLRLDPSVVSAGETWSYVAEDETPTPIVPLSDYREDDGTCLPLDGPLPSTIVFIRDGVPIPRRFVP